jgi:PAS domain S-box-containing protein
MIRSDRHSFIRAPLVLSILVFAGVFVLTQYLAWQRYQIISDLGQERLSTEVNAVRDRIKSTLSNSLSATRTLAYIIRQHGVPEDFDVVARNILESNPNIDALQLTRKGVITHTFPLRGNEAAIGHDVLANTAIREEAQKAIEKNALFFAGPFKLVQGGVAVVGRLPIYVNREFWGFSVVLIKLQTLLRAAGMESDRKNGFRYQLSKISPLTGKEEFFIPGQIENDKSEFASVEVPDGEWKLYVAPEHDPFRYLDPLMLSGFGLILSVTAAMFAHQLAGQPLRLRKLVDERTMQLSTVQDTYRITLERVSDAFVALDRDWLYTYMNHKAGEIFQRDSEKMIGKHIWKEFPEAIHQAFYKAYHKAMEEQVYVYLEEYYPPYDLWFENHIYPSADGISIYFRDVTKNKKAQQKVEASERYFRALIENSSDAIVLIDASGKVVYQSPSTQRISGYTLPEVQAMGNYALVHPDDQEEDIASFMELLKSPGKTVNRNHRLRHKNGNYIWLEGTYTNLLHDPDVKAIVYNYHDITDRILAEEKIMLEKNLSESTINRLPGVFYLYNRKGKFFRWNKNFETVSGYTADEVSKMTPLDFFDNDERQLVRDRIETVFTTGAAEVQAHFFTKDRRRIPYYFNGSKVFLDNEDYLIGMGIDISDRVEAEYKMKERTAEIEKLTAYLHHVREEERTHIAREIHDELGQQLTGLKMDAAWIGKKITQENDVVVEKVRTMIALIDDTIRSVRRIASELRPGILDDLGLIAALEWYCQEFAGRTGIPCKFSSTFDRDDVERSLSINIFRVCQETLTNVTRHAHAKHVTATLEEIGQFIVLTIADDGVGFDIEGVKSKKSLGLIGMRERALLFQGELQIESLIGIGTTVTLKVPFATTHSI